MNAAPPRPTWQPAPKPTPTMTMAEYAEKEMEERRKLERRFIPNTKRIDPVHTPITPRQKEVLDYIRANPGSEVSKIVAAISVPTRSAFNNRIEVLRRKGIKFRVIRGCNVARYWVISE